MNEKCKIDTKTSWSEIKKKTFANLNRNRKLKFINYI